MTVVRRSPNFLQRRGRSLCGKGKDFNGPFALQPPHQFKILHDGQVGKSSHGSKHVSPDENSLVAIWHLQNLGAKVGQPFNYAQTQTFAVNSQAEGTSCNPGLV